MSDVPSGTPTPSDKPVPPEVALTTQSVTKLIHEQIDRERKYFEFAQTQSEKDRAHFKHIFDRTMYFVGVLILLVSFFGYRSVDQMKADMRTTLDAETQKARLQLDVMRAEVQAATDEMKRQARHELDLAQAEVKKRVDAEFRTEHITNLVRTVARERTEKELHGVIRSETSDLVAKGIQEQAPAIQKSVEEETKRSVRELQPVISGIVTKETEAQIMKSVEPIQAQLKTYGNLIRIGTQATLAKNNNRKAFDYLLNLAFGPSSSASADEKSIAHSTVVALIQEKNSGGFRTARNFREPQTPESLKRFMVSGVAPERIAAIDTYPKGDNSLLPLLVKIINSDDHIDVVVAAFRRFKEMTKQEFRFPNYSAVNDWWKQNSQKFQ